MIKINIRKYYLLILFNFKEKRNHFFILQTGPQSRRLELPRSTPSITPIRIYIMKQERIW